MNRLSRQRILVTGGAGMIGSNLVKRLVGRGCSVAVADNLWRGKIENLNGSDGVSVIDLSRDFYQVDLSIPGALDEVIGQFDFVYHLADVVAGIGYVFNNQGSIFRNNLLINSNVVSSVRERSRVQGFIYVGTACSFPASKQTGVDAPPLMEEDQYPAAPESAYGWSKLMGEYEALLMEKETSIPVCIPVLHNVYGVPSDFDERTSQVIPSLVSRAVRYPSVPFTVWGTGSQARAFVHVNDVIDGLISAMENGLGKGIIQLGPDQCTTIREIAEAIAAISGKNMEIIFDITRPEGDRGRCANYSKAKSVLAWEPRVSLESGLAELYGWIEVKMHKA